MSVLLVALLLCVAAMVGCYFSNRMEDEEDALQRVEPSNLIRVDFGPKRTYTPGRVTHRDVS